MRTIDEEGNVSGSDIFEMIKQSPIPSTGGFVIPQCMNSDIFRLFTFGFFDCVKKIAILQVACDNAESPSMRAIWIVKIAALEEEKRQFAALTIYKE